MSAFDKVGGKDVLHMKKVIQAIQDFCNNFDLFDAWRTQHPDETRFSWANCSGKIKCRLDFWLISEELLNRVTKTDINAYYDSDHSPVTILIGPEEKQKQREPVFWKFNNSLLHSEEFVSKMKSIIKIAKEKHKYVTDKRLFWEMVKMEIRIFSIRFAKKKAREKEIKNWNFLENRENLNSRIDAASEESHLVCETRMLKIKLDQIAMQKTKSSIVRSRARWYESGEKCNKYFLNLSNRSHNKKHKTKLKCAEGSSTEEPQIILNEMRNFYQQLYTSQSYSPARFSNFLNSESLPKLDNVRQSLCESPITEVECLSALKTFQRNKTPGNDGLY